MSESRDNEFTDSEWVGLGTNGIEIAMANTRSGRLKVVAMDLQSLGFNTLSDSTIETKFLAAPWKCLGWAPVADTRRFPGAIYFLNANTGELAVCRAQLGNASQVVVTPPH